LKESGRGLPSVAAQYARAHTRPHRGRGLPGPARSVSPRPAGYPPARSAPRERVPPGIAALITHRSASAATNPTRRTVGLAAATGRRRERLLAPGGRSWARQRRRRPSSQAPSCAPRFRCSCLGGSAGPSVGTAPQWEGRSSASRVCGRCVAP